MQTCIIREHGTTKKPCFQSKERTDKQFFSYHAEESNTNVPQNSKYY